MTQDHASFRAIKQYNEYHAVIHIASKRSSSSSSAGLSSEGGAVTSVSKILLERNGSTSEDETSDVDIKSEERESELKEGFLTIREDQEENLTTLLP